MHGVCVHTGTCAPASVFHLSICCHHRCRHDAALIVSQPCRLQPERALDLLDAAFKLEGAADNALVHFVAGNAHAALGLHAAAAAAFRRAAALTAGAEPGSTRHQLNVTATENLLLEAERVLPPSWLPALHDMPRLAALQAGIARALESAAAASLAAAPSSLKPARVLVLGGLGVEAVLAAKAGAASVAALCLGNPLGAELTAQLAADSACAAGVVAPATAVGQLAGQPPFDLVVLADALGSSVDWLALRRQLAVAAPLLAPHAVLLPHAVRLRGFLAHCPAAVALNEVRWACFGCDSLARVAERPAARPHAWLSPCLSTSAASAAADSPAPCACPALQVDVPLLRADTGGLDLAPANRLLPRPTRSVLLPTQPHTHLTATATLLTVPLASLLPQTCGGSGSSDKLLAESVAELPIVAAGNADALAWWLEQELVPASHGTSQGAPLLSADPHGWSPQDAQLLPHIWQRLQFLDRRQLAPGQAVQVRCCLGKAASSSKSSAVDPAAAAAPAAATAGETLRCLSLEDSGSGNGSAAGSTGCASLDVQLDVLLAGSTSAGFAGSGDTSLLLAMSAEQAAVSAAVPRYHTSMLNDSARTVAYRDGIAAALQAAQRIAGGGKDGAPLVLEIGSGSGLLCLLACQAGAHAIVGCERLPELQAAAAALLEANGVADRVTILPKHSRELTVAGVDEAPAGQPLRPPADLPRRAAMLMHEIFGTDPFSEGGWRRGWLRHRCLQGAPDGHQELGRKPDRAE